MNIVTCVDYRERHEYWLPRSLLARFDQSGHGPSCPRLGDKRTRNGHRGIDADDPQRTSAERPAPRDLIERPIRRTVVASLLTRALESAHHQPFGPINVARRNRSPTPRPRLPRQLKASFRHLQHALSILAQRHPFRDLHACLGVAHVFIRFIVRHRTILINLRQAP